MATSEENDLIGYDPLAWMGDSIDEKDEANNNEFSDSDSLSEEQQLIDSKASFEEIAILNVATEDELVTDEIDSENNIALMEDITEGFMDVSGTVMQGTVGEESVSDRADEGICDLDATLTIQNVGKLHEQLKNILAMHDEIEINASDVSSIDTTTLQLLVSLKKDADKMQKKVTIIYPSPRFVESAHLLGLSDVLDVHDM
ncbi:MAG: STAS domain-containing protein [Gammaproteobacteria bacterium]